MGNSNYAIDHGQLEGKMQFWHKLRPGYPVVVANSPVLLFKTAEDAGIQFFATAHVLSAREELDGEGRWQLVDLEMQERLEPRVLIDLAGSLEGTRYFLEPERHFKRQIRKLSDRDFETIISNRIDPNRTIFRTIFAAFPLKMKADFVERHIADLTRDSRNRITNYESAAGVILDYFEGSICGPLRLCVQLRHLFNEPKSLPNPAQIDLSDSEGENRFSLVLIKRLAEFSINHDLIFEGQFSEKMRKLQGLPKEAVLTGKEAKWRDPIF